jgi:hypothetical protein
MDIKLPDWEHPTELLWPSDRQPDYSHVVPTFKSPTSDWWRAKNDEHAAKSEAAALANAEHQLAEGLARETRHKTPIGIKSY